jgi:DNA-binding SARP family transcriptional activator
MTSLEIRLFGEIWVNRDGEQLPGISTKAMELLCYLLLHRERGYTREALSAMFWPDASDTLARKYLRQAIWRLQSVLGDRDLLIVNSDWIRVNPRTALWLDVAEFEKAYSFNRDTPGHEMTDQQAQAVESAIALYRGDLIEAWYQDWCLHERDRLQLLYLDLLEQLMSYCEVRQHYAQGVAYGQRVLRYDAARERTHQNLMRLHYRAGDRAIALRQFERCAEAMAKQFDVHPSRETIALYHQVRGDYVEVRPRPAGVTSIRPGGDTAPPGGQHPGELLRGLQASLDLVQANVTALRRQLQQELGPVGQITEAV